MMHRAAPVLVLAVVGALLTGCGAAPPTLLPTTQYVPGAGWSARPAVPAGAPVERWRVPLGGRSAWVTDPAGTTLLVARGDGTASTTVQRLDPARGTVLWQAVVPGSAPTSVTLHGGRAPAAVVQTYTNGPPAVSTVTLLDPGSGRIRRTVPDGSTGFVAAVTDDLLVVSGLDEGDNTSAAGIDRATGARRWRTDAVVPATGDGTPLLGEAGDTLVALDPRTGAPLWSTPRTAFADAVTAAGTVLVTGRQTAGDGSDADRLRGAAGLDPAGGAGPGTVTALDAATGRARWSARSVLSAIGRSPTVLPLDSGALAVVSPQPAGTAALDPRTGRVLWRAPGVAVDTAIRVGSAGYAISLPSAGSITPSDELTVLDTGAGTVAGVLDDPDGDAADVAGGAVYVADPGRDRDSGDDEQVVAYELPRLTGTLWSVRTGPSGRCAPCPAASWPPPAGGPSRVTWSPTCDAGR